MENFWKFFFVTVGDGHLGMEPLKLDRKLTLNPFQWKWKASTAALTPQKENQESPIPKSNFDFNSNFLFTRV